MDCNGCRKRRSRWAAWWNSLWPAGTTDMPTGVPRALRLANQLKEHCAKHELSGEFAGVIVPRLETTMADTTKVIERNRLWSEECQMADARAGESLQSQQDAYQFTGGRTFKQPKNPYEGNPA